MSVHVIFFINMVLASIILAMGSRTWTGLLYAALFEAVFVLLVVILVAKAPWLFALPLYTLAIMALTISGAECTLFFVIFIIYYHITNYTNMASLRPKTLKFYYQEFKKTHVYTSMFGNDE